jgi:hypothetical protein
MTEEHRDFTTRRLLDPLGNPPRYVDEELPVRSIVLQGIERKTSERGPHGTAVGSYRVTGTFYETAMGSNSLRVTRLSLFSGSRNNGWYMHHSRKGTVEEINFPSPGQHSAIGAPYEPLYSFGPGTITWGWKGDEGGAMGSAFTMTQVMEGFVS